jgi:hypothetical protein
MTNVRVMCGETGIARRQKTPLGSSWEDCGRKRRGNGKIGPLKSLGFFSDLLSATQRVFGGRAGNKKPPLGESRAGAHQCSDGSPLSDSDGLNSGFAGQRHLAEIATLLSEKRSDPSASLSFTPSLDLVS